MEIFGNFAFDERSSTYKFNVQRVITWQLDYSIARVVGDHQDDKTNEDVEAIAFSNFNLQQFPQNIGKFFPNLKVLTVNSCNLTSISKYDLMGLKELRQLTLNGNLISHLPNNLFENTQLIEFVSLYGNRVEFIGRNIFDSLKHLKYVNLKMNFTIDACFKDLYGVTLDQLKKIINKNCQPEILDHITDLEEGFETTEEFVPFDFEVMKILDNQFTASTVKDFK